MQWLNSRLMQEQKYIQKLHEITQLPFILYSLLSFCPSSLRSYEALRLTRSRQWKRLPCLRSSKERWSCTDTGGGICEAWWLVVHFLAKGGIKMQSCKTTLQVFKHGMQDAKDALKLCSNAGVGTHSNHGRWGADVAKRQRDWTVLLGCCSEFNLQFRGFKLDSSDRALQDEEVKEQKERGTQWSTCK